MTSPASAEFVTKPEFEQAMARIDNRFDQLGARLDSRFTEFEARVDTRFAQSEARVDAGFAQSEARTDLRFAQMETLIERSTVTSIRWVVGMSFGLYALMFGLILFVLSRELPHA